MSDRIPPSVPAAAPRSMGFESFFERHYAAVVSSLVVALGVQAPAEEAAQEAFATAYRKWAMVEKLERPATWVYVVAVRRARRELARAERRSTAETRAVVGRVGAALDDASEAGGLGFAGAANLGVLTPRQRLAVVLHYGEDLSVADVARAMGCREGTVKATLHAARGRLRADAATPGLATMSGPAMPDDQEVTP